MVTASRFSGADRAHDIACDVAVDLAIDEALEALDAEAFDPQVNPDIKNTLRRQASLLHATARHWPGADQALRGQTGALLTWANQLHGDPRASTDQMMSLHRSLALLPEGLRASVGHLAALQSEQREFGRLKTALDGLRQSPHLAGVELVNVRNFAVGARLRLDAALKDLEAGRLDHMSDHLASIHDRMGHVRSFLLQHQVIAPGGEPTPIAPPRPAPVPNKPRKITPASLLRGAATRVAHAAKSARNVVVRHVSPSQIQRAKLDATAARDSALAPLRAELSSLTADLEWAELRRGAYVHTTVAPGASGQAGRRQWAQHTLGGYLQQAREAEAGALKALAKGGNAQVVAEQAIATIRAQLLSFNTSLDISDMGTLDFKFLQRPWQPGASSVR
jgi:hypothetical protein